MAKAVRTRIAPSPTGDPHVGTAYVALFNYALARQTRRPVRAAHRGHRPAAQHHRERGDDLRRPAMARSRAGTRAPTSAARTGPTARASAPRSTPSTPRCSSRAATPTRASAPGNGSTSCAPSRRPPRAGSAMTATAASIDQARGGDSGGRRARPTSSGSPCPPRARSSLTTCSAARSASKRRRSTTRCSSNPTAIPPTTSPTSSTTTSWGSATSSAPRSGSRRCPSTSSSTEAFGWEPPVFCHLPLLRNADKSKISKRKNPVSLNYYRRAGFLPEAMLNYLALMGWAMPDEREEFSLASSSRPSRLDRHQPRRTGLRSRPS